MCKGQLFLIYVGVTKAQRSPESQGQAGEYSDKGTVDDID